MVRPAVHRREKDGKRERKREKVKGERKKRVTGKFEKISRAIAHPRLAWRGGQPRRSRQAHVAGGSPPKLCLASTATTQERKNEVAERVTIKRTGTGASVHRGNTHQQATTLHFRRGSKARTLAASCGQQGLPQICSGALARLLQLSTIFTWGGGYVQHHKYINTLDARRRQGPARRAMARPHRRRASRPRTGVSWKDTFYSVQQALWRPCARGGSSIISAL